jgi:hypothetical protein
MSESTETERVYGRVEHKSRRGAAPFGSFNRRVGFMREYASYGSRIAIEGTKDGPVRFVDHPDWPARLRNIRVQLTRLGSIWGPKRAIFEADSTSLGV